ncbi:putative metal-binding membrane protein [Roseibium hamelinense]|uniref:Putative metal-binding membrane protein n=1 Tax=Roseibium hamelinense TaxID=150831 RepID=A0A562TJN7_9HYPH|nr:putative metal-binding membrane protein [Roseibium hamelinense]
MTDEAFPVTDKQPGPDKTRSVLAAERAWPFVSAVVAALSIAGWAYLSAMIAGMVPLMDMSEAGPGMGIFNLFNGFAGLPPEARAALAALCLPDSVSTFGMPGSVWAAGDLFKVFLMWFMMVLAMMLPSAGPMLRCYVTAAAHTGTSVHRIRIDTVLVALGYIVVWTGYALLATGAQWLMTGAGLLDQMMAPISLTVTASVLTAAGIYQFTPAKQACLARCWYPRWHFALQSPHGTRPAHAFWEGLFQGLLCLGCCWAMMTVMFAVGIMNIVWIAVLGALMALEKTFPNRVLTPLMGLLFLSWGGGLALVLVLGAGA